MKQRKCTSYIERKKHFHKQAMRYETQARLCVSPRRNGNKTTMSSSSSATASWGLKKRKQTPPLLCTFKYNREMCHPKRREREIESIIMPYALRYTVILFSFSSYLAFVCPIRYMVYLFSSLFRFLYIQKRHEQRAKWFENDYKTATMIIANNTFRVSTYTRSIAHSYTQAISYIGSNSLSLSVSVYIFTIFHSVTQLPTHYLS